MDALLGQAVVEGISPHLPATAYGGSVDVVAFRTPIALMLAIPFGFIPDLHLASVLFVAGSGALFLHMLGRGWWWAGLILVWPFSEVLKHGKWTFLVGALIIASLVVSDERWAGLWLALAVGINLWPAVVAVGFLVSRRWRTALWSGVWFVALTLVMLPTSVSIDGTLSALAQDATYNPENRTLMAFAPWYVIPLGMASFAWWARARESVLVMKVGTTVGLAFSPVLWPAYLPALAVFALPGGSGGSDAEVSESLVIDLRAEHEEARETPSLRSRSRD